MAGSAKTVFMSAITRILCGLGRERSSGGVTRQGVVLTDLQSLVDVNKILVLSGV